MANHLDFLNKNMYRKYPIHSYSNLKSIENVDVPVNLLTGMSVSAPFTNSLVYISFIFAYSTFVNVVLSDQMSGKTVGSFTVVLTQDFQPVPLVPFESGYSGQMITGELKNWLSFQGSHFLNYDNGRIEDSLVFCYTPPAVRKLTHNDQTATGDISVVGVNVAVTKNLQGLSLSVIDKTKILSHQDNSSVLGNCSTPIITTVNTVTPDINGNIDIIGISPITLNILSSIIQLTTGPLTLSDLCQEKNKRLPPLNTSDDYFENILTTDEPEWKSW